MITISVCMIVKNESDILARCLDSLRGIWDELIIIDTGSTDNTKEIAGRYTDSVYDHEWTGDFSAARNYALSFASCEYIYTADADEILEGENYERFLALKACLDDSVDVVQMYYGNQLDNGTVYNFDKELRPKLFKRIRPIRFMDPIHETLDLDMKVIDTDIVITHRPTSLHTGRDLGVFARMIEDGKSLSSRLQRFLDRELYLCEDQDSLERFAPYLVSAANDPERTQDEILEICTLLTRYYRICGDYLQMFDYCLKVAATENNSEICTELGHYYLNKADYDNAAIWYYNAAHETAPILSIHAGSDVPLNGLARVYDALGMKEMAADYRAKAMEPVEIQSGKDCEI